MECQQVFLAPVEGIEPSTRGFGDRRSTIELHQHGGVGEIRTHDFADLQSDPLDHSSTTPY